METLPLPLVAAVLAWLPPYAALPLARTSRQMAAAAASPEFAQLFAQRHAAALGHGALWALPQPLQAAVARARFAATREITWSKTDFVLNWIPATVGVLVALTSLTANNCNLGGDIPREIDNLRNLVSLDLAFNGLSGCIPPLPSLLKLATLRLESNELFGPIPSQLGLLKSCKTICLSNNSLSGSIPPELGSLSQLEQLYLGRNKLTDNLPPELGDLLNLKELDLSTNCLSGPIPLRLGKLSKLRALFLDRNQLSGSIPRQFGNLASLEDLFLSRNRLSGNIPRELGKLKNLVTLQLSRNLLSGAIPKEIAELDCLAEVYLKGNILDPQISEDFNRESRVYRLLLEEGFDGIGGDASGSDRSSLVTEEHLSRPMSELRLSR